MLSSVCVISACVFLRSSPAHTTCVCVCVCARISFYACIHMCNCPVSKGQFRHGRDCAHERVRAACVSINSLAAYRASHIHAATLMVVDLVRWSSWGAIVINSITPNYTLCARDAERTSLHVCEHSVFFRFSNFKRGLRTDARHTRACLIITSYTTLIEHNVIQNVTVRVRACDGACIFDSNDLASLGQRGDRQTDTQAPHSSQGHVSS